MNDSDVAGVDVSVFEAGCPIRPSWQILGVLSGFALAVVAMRLPSPSRKKRGQRFGSSIAHAGPSGSAFSFALSLSSSLADRST
jgi:hypothetical protein